MTELAEGDTNESGRTPQDETLTVWSYYLGMAANLLQNHAGIPTLIESGYRNPCDVLMEAAEGAAGVVRPRRAAVSPSRRTGQCPHGSPSAATATADRQSKRPSLGPA